MLVDAVALRLGLAAVQIMIAGLLIIWWLLLTSLITLAQRLFKLPQMPRLAPITATLLILATLTTAPTPVQSVYWLIGAGAYFFPLVVAAFYLWLSIQPRLSERLTLTLCFFTAFLMAGTPGAVTFSQLVLIGLALLLIRQAPYRQRQIAGLVGALLGLVIVMIGPGIQSRGNLFATPNFGRALGQTLTSSGLALAGSLILAPLTALAVIVLPTLFAYFFDGRYIKPRIAAVYILLIPALIYILQCISFGLAYYVMSTNLPGRAWIIPEYLIWCLLTVWGYVIGLALRSSHQQVKVTPRALGVVTLVIGLVLVAVAATSSVSAVKVAESLQQYAALWDKRDAELQPQAGATQPVKATSFHGWFGLDDLVTDDKYWVNRCVAGYYKVPGFTIKQWIRMP
jgi:hypothetical protein